MLKTVVTVGGGGTPGLTYEGAWNANTNSPALASGVGTNGDYYVVDTAGSTNLDGITDWEIGDWAIFNGTAWQKIDQTNTVSSVNGQVGAVVLGVANIAGAVANTVNILTTGLATGGGALTGNVTITVLDVPAANVTGLGTMATQNANAVAITGGSGVFANVTITSNLYANLASSNVAAMLDPSMMLAPEGYIEVSINGATKKIPYYGV
jgi:hypothetical protein